MKPLPPSCCWISFSTFTVTIHNSDGDTMMAPSCQKVARLVQLNMAVSQDVWQFLDWGSKCYYYYYFLSPRAHIPHQLTAISKSSS